LFQDSFLNTLINSLIQQPYWFQFYWYLL